MADVALVIKIPENYDLSKIKRGKSTCEDFMQV